MDKYVSPVEFMPLGADTRPALVCLHDINANPFQMKHWLDCLIENLRKKEFLNELQIWVPEIYEKGNCSLENASRNLYELCIHIIDTQLYNGIKNPKLILAGFSNGARIASHLETVLRLTNPEAEILLISIGGPLRGTKALNFIYRWFPKLTDYMFNHDVVKELRYDCSFSRFLDSTFDIRKNPPKSHRYFSYYYSNSDEQVYPSETSYPSYFDNNRYEYLSIKSTSGVLHNQLLDYEPFIEDQSDKIYYFLRY